MANPQNTSSWHQALDHIERQIHHLRSQSNPTTEEQQHLDALQNVQQSLRMLQKPLPPAPPDQPKRTSIADPFGTRIDPGSDTLPPDLVKAGFQQAETLEVARPTTDRLNQPFPAELLFSDAHTSDLLIANYEVICELGRGGMGVVYKARQQGLDRIVALKMILSAEHASADEQERFHREAQAIARLQHPGIVQIYDIGVHQGKPYFSLELLSGGSLDDRLRQLPMKPEEAATMVEKLARAIHVAHQAGIIHRDLKPANVLLTEEGAPKITDFGLARQIDVVGKTQTGAIVGTPSYMAPEQAQGKNRQIGPAADTYALGAILYECLTGRPPFNAATAMDTVLQVIGNTPVAPTRLQTNVPRDLETICMKCLEKDPHKRYDSALSLAEDLQRFTRGEPILARPVSRPERAWRWCRRNPMVAFLLACIFVVLMAGTIVSTLFAWQAKTALDNEGIARGQAEQNASRATKSATEAKRNLTRALVQEKKAQNLAKVARENMKTAIDNEQQAKQFAAQARLTVEDLYVAQGLRLIDEHDHRTGMLWLAQPLRNLHGPSENEKIHRLRLAAQERFGQRWELKNCFFHIARAETVVFSPDGKKLLTGSSASSIHLWDVATGKPLVKSMFCSGGIVKAIFSPDGAKIATVTRGVRHLGAGVRDANARIWSTATGLPLTRPLPLPSHGQSIAFSPDGKKVIVGTGSSVADLKTRRTDAVALMFDATTGKQVGPPLKHGHIVRDAWFSPDGKTILTGSVDGTAAIWDAGTGKKLRSLRHDLGVRRARFSADGTKVVTSSYAGGTARIWNAATGMPVGKPLIHEARIRDVCFSPDGKKVATAGGGVLTANGSARIWDASTGSPLGLPIVHRETIYSVIFSPDSKYVVTCGGEETSAVNTTGGERIARVWDATTGKPVSSAMNHQGYVWRTAFSPDGTYLATASADGTVRLWQAPEKVSPDHVLKLAGKATAFAFSADSRFLATGSAAFQNDSAEVRVWDVQTGMPTTEPLLQTGGEVTQAQFDSQGQHLHVVTGHSNVVIRNAKTGKPVSTFSTDRPASFSLLAPGGGYLVTAHGSTPFTLNEVQEWDLTTRKLLTPLKHQFGFSRAAFSRDGRFLVTGAGVFGGNRGEVRVWNARTGQPMSDAFPYSSLVRDVDFSPDGIHVAAGGQKGFAYLWNAKTGKQVGAPMRHLKPIHRIRFNSDGNYVATTSLDKTARVWDAKTGKPATPLLIHEAMVNDVVFDSQGIMVATASNDGTARIWDARTGQPISPSLPHDGVVRKLTFSPSGQWLATVSDGKEVLLWKVVEEARPVQELLRTYELEAGQRLDPQGGLTVMFRDEWKNAWQTYSRNMK